MRFPLAIGLCCALLAALAALAIGWTSARADESNGAESPAAPLEVMFYADALVCTAGSMMAVHWEIHGGVEPYQAMLNGEPADASSNSAPVPCGPAYDIPAWLRGIVQPPPINVDLTVLDAAGSETTHNLTLERAPPLPAPRVRLWASFCGGDDMTIVANANGTGLPENRSHRYLVRWRTPELAEWNYDAYAGQLNSNSSERVFRYSAAADGVRFAAQVARVRSLAEQATPNLLNWSPMAYATTVSPPLDLTARATHDTITISWGPAAEGLTWTAGVSPVDRRERDYDRRHGAWDRSRWSWKAVGPALPYGVNHDGLLPDTRYRVWVNLDHNCYCFGDTEGACAASRGLTVRTAPAPPGWSREPRRPQNVRATAHPGGVGFVVAWDPPLEGEERAYEVIAHEYGTPRPDPITPVGGVGGPSYVVRLPLSATYEVFVRHLGIEDEEARVVVEPPLPESENIDEYMTLPDWHVEHRRPAYGEDALRGYKFVVTWDTEHGGKIVQVRWLRDGHAMTQSAEQPPIVIWTADPGPHPFQLRLRRSEFGPWSRWSSALRVSAKPAPPESLYVREQQGALIASWRLLPTTPPGYFPDAHDLLRDLIDGFRVYLHRTGEQIRVLDVGMATSAEFPIPPDSGEYEVQVASYSDALGEGRAITQTFSQSIGPTLYMSDVYDHYDHSICDRVGGVPALVSWRIQGGAAPYTMQADGSPTTVTSDHEGLLEVHCDTEDMQNEVRTEVRTVVTVTDARGRTDQDGIRYTIIDLRDDDGEPISLAESWHRLLPPLALSRFYVQSNSLLLRWNRWNGNVMWQQDRHLRSFVVRWREIGTQTWRYRAADGARPINCRDSSSKWTLDELAPNTEYEVQIATYFGDDDFAQPGRLDWTKSHIARTLPDAIYPTLQRRGSDIIVSWPSITEATDYTVTLHAVGVSWWKVYEPQGGGLEQAVFADVPAALDAELRAEVEVTAAISADQGGPVIEDYAYCD